MSIVLRKSSIVVFKVPPMDIFLYQRKLQNIPWLNLFLKIQGAISLTKTSNVFKFSKHQHIFLRLILYIQILMYRNLHFLVKSVTVVCLFLVYALLFSFSQKKWWLILDEQKLTTLKHLAATTLQFLLQLKLIFCTFLKKEFQLKKNKLISRCFFQ